MGIWQKVLSLGLALSIARLSDASFWGYVFIFVTVYLLVGLLFAFGYWVVGESKEDTLKVVPSNKVGSEEVASPRRSAVLSGESQWPNAIRRTVKPAKDEQTNQKSGQGFIPALDMPSGDETPFGDSKDVLSPNNLGWSPTDNQNGFPKLDRMSPEAFDGYDLLSNKRSPSAIFELAHSCHYRFEIHSKAKEVYKKLIELHPGSLAAGDAKVQLELINYPNSRIQEVSDLEFLVQLLSGAKNKTGLFLESINVASQSSSGVHRRLHETCLKNSGVETDKTIQLRHLLIETFPSTKSAQYARAELSYLLRVVLRYQFRRDFLRTQPLFGVLVDNRLEGGLVEFSDGSQWEIADEDTSLSMEWSKGAFISFSDSASLFEVEIQEIIRCSCFGGSGKPGIWKVVDVRKNGGIVELNDESKWEVLGKERSIALAWSAGTKIVALGNSLVRVSVGSKVRAMRLG
jgi:hypothetical protein